MPPVDAALYHRVSSLDQDPTLARRELRQAARVRGLRVVLDVEETGTGAANDRPGLLEVMSAARAGRVGAVLVWKLDRFGRSALDVLSNVRALQSAGVRFVATTQGLEVRPDGSDSAASQLTLTVLAAVAEFERELVRERTVLGLARARERGAQIGRPRSGPAGQEVVELREVLRLSWRDIARVLDCDQTSARRAYKRATPGAL